MRRTVAILVLGVPGVLGCRGDMDQGDDTVQVNLAISPTPPAVGSARLLISVLDSTDAPLEGARITVEGNMSHAGMTPVRDTAVAEEPGRYAVPGFGFSMAGEWLLDVEAVLPDGREARRRFSVHVVGSPRGGLSRSGGSEPRRGHQGEDLGASSLRSEPPGS